MNAYSILHIYLVREYRTAYRYLTLRACAVGTSLTFQSSHFKTACFDYLPDLPAVLCFLHFSWSFQFFFSSLFSYFVSCACVYSEHGTAGERGTVAGVSGLWRVEGGVARSAVAVFVARRRVCLEIRGNHEWALPGFLVWFRL